MIPSFESAVELLWQLLSPFSPEDRYSAIVEAMSFQPSAEWEPADQIGRVRAAFACVLESMSGQAVPVKALAAITASDDSTFRNQLWAASESSNIEGFMAAMMMMLGILERHSERRSERESVHFANADLACFVIPRSTVRKRLT